MGPPAAVIRAFVFLVVLSACPSRKPPSEAEDLAAYLDRVAQLDAKAREQEVARWQLDRAHFERLIVEPFRGAYDGYDAKFKARIPELGDSLAELFAKPVVRKHFAGDPDLTPSQSRLRWTVPVMYPAYVVRAIDTAFVRLDGHWYALAGLDEAIVDKARAIDPTCAARLELAGPPGPCTDVGWAIADAALRGGGDRFIHACKLAAPHCQLHGLAELDAAVRELQIVRNTEASTGQATFQSLACTKPTYNVRDDIGGFVQINDRGCHTCSFVAEPDNSRVLEAYAHALRDQPAAFRAAAGLTQISVCSHIEQRGEVEITVGGTIDPQRGGLFLLTGEFDLTGAEVVAHEMFHLFDRHPKMLRYAAHDEEWPTEGGYVNDYARSRVREDHATVYQFMIARPAELCAAAAKDPLILKKAQLIRNRIASVIEDVSYLDKRLPCLQ
jgi:hypothetical protein